MAKDIQVVGADTLTGAQQKKNGAEEQVHLYLFKVLL